MPLVFVYVPIFPHPMYRSGGGGDPRIVFVCLGAILLSVVLCLLAKWAFDTYEKMKDNRKFRRFSPPKRNNKRVPRKWLS